MIGEIELSQIVDWMLVGGGYLMLWGIVMIVLKEL